jgi:eukaryotic-like serine/threonine-protein kinase
MSGDARFGPFALSLETADLEANGRSIRLPEQQFQILSMLILKGGALVSRDDIRKMLWPNDTIVEYDRSINTAILKLRSALTEIAGQGSWIETIPRRGYRLLVSSQPPAPDVQCAIAMPVPASAHLNRGNLVGQKVSHYRVLEVLEVAAWVWSTRAKTLSSIARWP